MTQTQCDAKTRACCSTMLNMRLNHGEGGKNQSLSLLCCSTVEVKLLLMKRANEFCLVKTIVRYRLRLLKEADVKGGRQFGEKCLSWKEENVN